MTKNLLVEIGLEEIPANIVTSSMEQLKKKVESFLCDNRLTFYKIEMFSTPRRLAVRVRDLANQQSDLINEFKGPAKKFAVDKEGKFTKAAETFAHKQGLQTSDIKFREIKGKEYAFVTRLAPCKPVEELMTGVVDLLKKLSFPVNMHWGTHSFKYVRPIHTLIILLDDNIIVGEILNIKSDRISKGHRFLGEDVVVQSAMSYEDDLRRDFVIANPIERRNMIIDQIKQLEKVHQVKVDIDGKLLNEVLNLVEYPTAFMGKFDKKYLKIPEEVLITSMQVNQRYFVVRNLVGDLLPYFVSVRNGNAEYLENVIGGNQMVLSARLDDAAFFWREDRKLAIDTLVKKLQEVTVHEKIGSIADSMERTKAISKIFAGRLNLTVEEQHDLLRAAEIYKFDLLTGMVSEFDQLQGIMGEKYALLAGENAYVARAIREHYLPTSSTGKLPETVLGAVLALADKLNVVLSFFSVGLIPNGSSDPFGIRRETTGIIRILEKFGWQIDLVDLIDEVYLLDLNSLIYKNKLEVLDFIRQRIKKMMPSDISSDIVTAVLGSSTLVVSNLFETAQLLSKMSQEIIFKPAIESLSRVFNLSERTSSRNGSVKPSLFENDEEKNLHEAVENINFCEDMNTNLTNLFALSPVINKFFEKTMVMTEDQILRENRLIILSNLSKKARILARFNKINTKTKLGVVNELAKR